MMRGWVPSARMRWTFGAASVVLLGAAVAGSFVGPITVNTYGPEPAGYQFQFDLLMVLTVASAFLVNGAFYRLVGGSRFLPLFAGTVAIAAGTILTLGYWTPAGSPGAPCYPNCGFTAPFSTQGGLFAEWGFLSVLLWGTARFSEMLRRRAPTLQGAPPSPPLGHPAWAPYPVPPLEGAPLSALYQECLEGTRAWSRVTARRIGVGTVTVAVLLLVFGISTVLDIVAPTNPASPSLRLAPWFALASGLLATFVLALGYFGRRRFVRIGRMVESGRTPPSSLLAMPPEYAIRQWMLERDPAPSAVSGRSAENRAQLRGALTLIRFGRMLSEWNQQLMFSEYSLLALTGLLAIGYIGLFVAPPRLPIGVPFLILLLGPLVFLPALAWSFGRSRDELRRLNRRSAPLAGYEYGLDAASR